MAVVTNRTKMPYKDHRTRPDYNKRQYGLLKKKLAKTCPICNVRTFYFGGSCKPCAKQEQGITWARKTALIRDDYTCQICGIREIGLVEVDHIIGSSLRPDLYSAISNLMTLCPNCHKRKTIRERKHGNNSNPPQSQGT